MFQDQAIVSVNNEINYNVIDNNHNILLLSLFLLLFTMILIKLKPHTQKKVWVLFTSQSVSPRFLSFSPGLVKQRHLSWSLKISPWS